MKRVPLKLIIMVLLRDPVLTMSAIMMINGAFYYELIYAVGEKDAYEIMYFISNAMFIFVPAARVFFKYETPIVSIEQEESW